MASLSGQAQSLSFALEVRATDPQLRGLDVLDLAVDRDGHWWMATLDEGVVRYDGDALHRAEFSGVPPIVLAVAPADGGAFAATSEGLRFVGLNGTAEPVSGMSEPTVDVDAHGDTVWALRADGLALRLPGQSFVPVPLAHHWSPLLPCRCFVPIAGVHCCHARHSVLIAGLCCWCPLLLPPSRQPS